jgi:hypothetical protein
MAARKKKPKAIKLPLPKPVKPLVEIARESLEACSEAVDVFDTTVDNMQASLKSTLEYLGGLLAEVEGEELATVQLLIASLTASQQGLVKTHETVSRAFEIADGFEGSVDDHFNNLQAAAQFLEHIADPYQRNPFLGLDRDQAALHAADVVLGETG